MFILWIIKLLYVAYIGQLIRSIGAVELHKLFFLFHQLGMMKVCRKFCRTWS